MALYNQLTNSIRLGQAKQDELARSIERGVAFFNQFNDSRMELAFSNFSEDMKKALYEVLFFLHVNDPKFENHTYTTLEIQRVEGRLQEVEVTQTANLYLEGCPAGVMGMESLSPRFQADFLAYIQEHLESELPVIEGFCPIFSVASLGSIGTIGHKQTASDLDLQVQYELSPFILEPQNLGDANLLEFSKGLIQYFGRIFAAKKKYTKEQLARPEIRAELVKYGKIHLKKRFPLLFKILILKEGGKVTAPQKIELIHEIVGASALYQKYCLKAKRLDMDQKLKERIGRIQTYVQEKYPKAEIYLFAYSNDNYRDGKHGTTLESKEASGSAYELILNYETLMPGIQFTPMIPVHFLMPEEVNSNRKQYERLIEYLRFHFIDLYDPYKRQMVDLGSTPPLTLDYMIAHSGAIYWESFKASSGNLPKAFLNLLRLEMLFDPRFNISIMELIKKPDQLDQYVQATEESAETDPVEEEEEADFFADYGILDAGNIMDEGAIMSEADSTGGMGLTEVFKMEERFKPLQEDPWWLRYKALKIGFSDACQTISDKSMRERISSIIDLGFALHIRISDVFAPPKKKAEVSYRDQVLRHFLERAFPLTQKVHLEHIFMGEVQAVSQFEAELKELFKASMTRVLKIVEKAEGQDQTNREEFKIWYHYYEKHFEPKANVIRPDILSHLKVARDRLKIGLDKSDGSWFFSSVQKKDAKDGNFSAEALEHLPSEVTLFRHRSFLHGIAHCIMNGYYGTFNKGTLFERDTQLELMATHLDLGKRSSNDYCYFTPDLIERLVSRIIKGFPPQEYDYRDCIYKEREVTEVLLCLNLLAFGRLTILYRDNLKVWYIDEFNHPKMEKDADQLYEAYDLQFSHRELLETLKHFFESQKIKLAAFPAGSMQFWMNPNSARTGHPSTKRKQKEEDLATEFKKAIFLQLTGPS